MALFIAQREGSRYKEVRVSKRSKIAEFAPVIFIYFWDAYDFNWTMKKPTMAFAQIYLTQLRKFCDEEEHAVKAEKLKSNGKIYGEPNSYKMVSQSQIESCLERVQESVWQTYITHLVWVKDESSFDAHLARNPHWAV